MEEWYWWEHANGDENIKDNMDMVVNLFLSSHIWVKPLNAFGVRQHVAALYEDVFRGYDVRVFPKDSTTALLADGLLHFPALLGGKVNVIAPGYPVVAGALASWVRRNPGLIVHTWKVPGMSDERRSARAYDCLLRRVIGRARARVPIRGTPVSTRLTNEGPRLYPGCLRHRPGYS